MCVLVFFQGGSSVGRVPSLSELFHVGQLLPFSVLEVGGGRVVALTANPTVVNSNLTANDIQPKMVRPCC